MENLIILPIDEKHFNQIIRFTDEYIGSGYYTLESLNRTLTLSTGTDGKVYSYGLWLAQAGKLQLKGIRFTYPPGNWIENVKFSLYKNRWKATPEKVAYFKSLFIDIDFQGTGWGPKLSSRSQQEMIELGAEALLAHAWVKSPNNSSIRYLKKFGFSEVGIHTNFWSHIDYLCSGCLKHPCQCSAMEMIKHL